MRKSLMLAAFVALQPGRGNKATDGTPRPKRPSGPLIWFHCSTGREISGAKAIIRQYLQDREQASFLVTGNDVEGVSGMGPDVIFQPNPQGSKADQAAFLAHWKPDCLMWLGSEMDPALLVETDALDIPRYLVEADAERLRPLNGRWLPGVRRAVLSRFDRVLTVDNASAARIARMGVDEDIIVTAGTFDEEVPLLPWNEREYRDMSEVLGTRPVWLAADCPMEELDYVGRAHQNACRRSHRLLLIVNPRNPADGPAMQMRLQEMGIETVLRSDGDPVETTRAYVADFPNELGMWYRLSPVSYLGGSLTSGTRHPFEAAALGSVVIHGPITAPHPAGYSKLDGVGGAKPLRNGTDLADAVETLLAPDKVALIAHAAWQITSQGAEVNNQVAELINAIIDGKS